ncbi:uncharacterized protein LOC141601808 [Silene latifolia]|uniref:uncharacterized protein LOC141601808 n=1 Tax=Silene latifolia TaxID=37657 RepID=UPI003D772D5F
MEIVYHEGKANVVADALSRKSVHALWTAGIREKQKYNTRIEKWRAAVVSVVDTGVVSKFEIHSDGSLRFAGRWFVQDNDVLKRKILPKAKSTPYSVLHGGDKLYKDLKKTLWWPNMKKDVAAFVARCLVCQRELQSMIGTQLKMSTTFYPARDGHTERTTRTLKDILRSCVMEFGGTWEERLDLIEFSYNNSYYASNGIAPFEALYGRKCRSPICWDDIADAMVLGP